MSTKNLRLKGLNRLTNAVRQRPWTTLFSLLSCFFVAENFLSNNSSLRATHFVSSSNGQHEDFLTSSYEKHGVASMLSQRQAFLDQRVQMLIYADTSKWRGFPAITYAGYGGPWIEDAYETYWFNHESLQGSKRLYLPIHWTACHLHCSDEEKIALRQYIRNLDKSKKYFTVLTLAQGFSHFALEVAVPTDLDLLIFSGGGCTKGTRTTNVVIPLVKDVPAMSDIAGTELRDVSFIGRLDTHIVRQELSDMFNQTWAFFEKADNWAAIMQASTFSLCPRGWGPTSYRLYEAIHLESIPIYVWDEELLLPYTQEIPWNDMAIIIHRSDMHDLPDRIRDFDVEKGKALLKKWKARFSLDATCAQIHAIVGESSRHVEDCLVSLL